MKIGNRQRASGNSKKLKFLLCALALKPIADLQLLISSLSAVLFALCSVAEAQQPKKVPRIGYLTGSSLSSQSANAEAFRQGLRDLGYVEGKTILIEWRAADGNRDRKRALAA